MQTLISCPFHPRVTAVARKRPRSFCQKCRRQVTQNTVVIYFLNNCFAQTEWIPCVDGIYVAHHACCPAVPRLLWIGGFVWWLFKFIFHIVKPAYILFPLTSQWCTISCSFTMQLCWSNRKLDSVYISFFLSFFLSFFDDNVDILILRKWLCS